jgi:putative sigma-54 modulation protein
MKFIISGKNLDVTEALKDKIHEKVGKLEKFFPLDTKVNATLMVRKNDQTIEVTIPHNKTLYKAVETNPDMYTSIDRVVDALERQILKNKTKTAKKIQDKRQKSPLLSNLDDIPPEQAVFNPQDLTVIKTKKFAAKPMSIEEAVLQLNHIHDDFFMFRNASTSEVNVLYKRNDGHFGLIEPTE